MSTIGTARNACADPGAFHYQRHRAPLLARDGIDIHVAEEKPDGFLPPRTGFLSIGGDYSISLTMRFYVPDHEPFKAWTPQKTKRVK
jgi:hypothetical protein